jgi:hypothetical protein
MKAVAKTFEAFKKEFESKSPNLNACGTHLAQLKVVFDVGQFQSVEK